MSRSPPTSPGGDGEGPRENSPDDSATLSEAVYVSDDDVSTEPDIEDVPRDPQQELGRVFEEQERRLERLLRDRVRLERACLAFLSGEMPEHDREDLLHARDELSDLVQTVIQAHARIRDSMATAAPRV